jgi:hypothetical protein
MRLMIQQGLHSLVPKGTSGQKSGMYKKGIAVYIPGDFHRELISLTQSRTPIESLPAGG